MKQTTTSSFKGVVTVAILALSFCMGTVYAEEVVCPKVTNMEAKATLSGDHHKGDTLVCSYTSSSGFAPAQAWSEDGCDLSKNQCAVNVIKSDASKVSNVSTSGLTYQQCIDTYVAQFRERNGKFEIPPIEATQMWNMKCKQFPHN